VETIGSTEERYKKEETVSNLNVLKYKKNVKSRLKRDIIVNKLTRSSNQVFKFIKSHSFINIAQSQLN